MAVSNRPLVFVLQVGDQRIDDLRLRVGAAPPTRKRT
jgi:hypothetical protein